MFRNTFIIFMVTICILCGPNTMGEGCEYCESQVPQGLIFDGIAECELYSASSGTVYDLQISENPTMLFSLGCGSCTSKSPVHLSDSIPYTVSPGTVKCVSSNVSLSSDILLIFTVQFTGGGDKCLEYPARVINIPYSCDSAGCNRTLITRMGNKFSVVQDFELNWHGRMYVKDRPDGISSMMICNKREHVTVSYQSVFVQPQTSSGVPCSESQIELCLCNS